MITKSVKTVLSSRNPVPGVQRGFGFSHDQFVLKVHKAWHPNHNQSALRMLEKFRIINPDQYVLKMK